MGGVVGSRRHDAEASRIEQFSSDQAGKPCFTLALAIRPAQGAQPRFRRIAPVRRPQNVICFRKAHVSFSFIFICSQMS